MSSISTSNDIADEPTPRVPLDPSRPWGVRQASSPTDWARAADLLHDHVAWIERSAGIAVFEAQPGFAVELMDVQRAYSGPRSALFLAEDDAGVCGTLAVRIDDGAAAEIKRMYVDPLRRGRGHAGRLLRAALGWARDLGATSAWLETLPGTMDTAIGLYRRHGFRPTESKALVDVDHAIVMTLPLAEAARP